MFCNSYNIVQKKKHEFNCAQRGAQNLLETYPQFMFGVAATGLLYPKEAAALTVVYSIGAVAFARGYATGDPDNRYKGFFRVGVLSRIGFFGALIGSGIVAYKLIAK